MSDTITVTGNIATEPELKHTPAGVTITTFRVASSQRRFDKNTGAWIEGSTNWYSVSAFRSLGEHAFQSLKKGNRVVLTGRLKLREWDTGAKKGTTAEIEVDAIGHDLLWGSTTFHRDSAGRSDHREDGHGAAAGVGGAEQEWSTAALAEGVHSTGDGSWSVPLQSDDDHQRVVETVGAESPF